MADILITIVGVVIIILLWIMLYDSNRFVVKHYEFEDDRIRENCRAVVLADLHNKRYGKDNEKLIEAIRKEHPDFILVAGDILTAKPGKSLDVACNLLRELAKDYPVYYGNGNHEHRLHLYPDVYGDMGERYDKALADMKVHSLVNAHETLEQYGITVFGAQIDRLFYKRFRVQHMDSGYMESILGQPCKSTYSILIAHNPDYFPQYGEWGADLVLAGHVHGGIARVPFWGKGVISPNIRFFPKYDGGLFREGKSTMLLSRGLGMHTIPVRLFNPGELLVIDFLKTEKR